MLYTKHQIVDEINNSFPCIPITEKVLKYLLGYNIELSNNVENYFENKTWREVDWFYIKENFNDSSHIAAMLCIEVYKKVFPSLLVFCLESSARTTNIIENFINGDLNINNSLNTDERSSFLSSLTDKQANCVSLVLAYSYEKDHDILFKEALDSYWSVFLDKTKQ